MASVWKRLQRVNKRAAKFQYTASYHRIDLEITPKWKPNKLSIVWTRRSRRVITEPQDWEPSLKDPLKGSVVFAMPVNQTVAVTLFKDSRTNELEDKDWTFVLEDVPPSGKRRRIAWCNVNMRKYASLEPSQRSLRLPLEVRGTRAVSAAITLTLHCVLLREGPATDEDMQSLASLLSVNNNSDIAVLEDLDEDDYTLSDHSTKQMFDLRQQMEEMTQSLTNSDIAATPNSVQSLKFDARTPTPATPSSPLPEGGDEFRPNVDNFDLKFDLKSDLKFTSTPKSDDGFKSVVLKPKTIAMRNLKPLELKSNLNNIGLDKNDNESEDLDKTPTGDIERLGALSMGDKDKTPVAELLGWCQGVTREYHSCRVSDLSSFRSGLPFCAIIHRFRPELIDFSGLQPDEAESNLRIALEASAALGLPPVLTAADVLRPAPDKLAIMTYLFQLRAYFTGNELQVEQLGNDETESSYLVGRHDTDGALPRDLFSREVSARRSRGLIDKSRLPPRKEWSKQLGPLLREQDPQPPPSPDKPKDILVQSRALLGKVLSPAKDLKDAKPSAKWFADITPEPLAGRPLMTRKELTDPFGSDDEDEMPPQIIPLNGLPAIPDQKPTIEPAVNDPLTTPELPAIENPARGETLPTPPEKIPTPELPKPTPQLLSRHDELKERARQLLEATKREAREKDKMRRQSSKEKEAEAVKENGVTNGDSPKKQLTEEERQAMLRERARKLIADARAGIVSPTSPLSPARARPTMEIITKQSLLDEIAAAGAELESHSPASVGSRSRHSSASPDRSAADRVSVGSGRGGSPLASLGALADRLADDATDANDESREGGSYIASELAALEREQSAVDEKAAALEKQLRAVMEGEHHPTEEDRLMAQWFNLVNKKNALLRRQMQLNILEQEEDLSRRCELLAQELRLSLGVDEWRKTPGQKRRERLLLQELLSAVNERDRLVQEMDEQEKAIADDDAIERNLSQVEIQRKNNCILQ